MRLRAFAALSPALLVACDLVAGLGDIKVIEGQGGSGGQGGGVTCSPGAVEECYDGPPATKNVGVCKAGKRFCNQDGNGYTPCQDQLLPGTEICNTPQDEDCSGTPNDNCPCMPGEMQNCYSGPMGTANIGICKQGTQTCNLDGKGFGTCMGEVTPIAEKCSTPLDEDCNGKAFDDTAAGCVCEPNMPGACTIAGQQGPCAMGMGTCAADGKSVGNCMQTVVPAFDDCTTAADEDCDGTAVSACTGDSVTKTDLLLGSGADDVAYTAATDATGNLYWAGVTEGAISSDGYYVTTGALRVIKTDPTGALIWNRKITPSGGAGSYAVVRGMGLGGAGNIFVAGELQGSLSFGAIPPAITSMGVDAFVAKLDPNGNFVWAKRFGDNAYQAAYGLAVDVAGDVFITGEALGVMDLGGGDVGGGGDSDVFVAKLSGLDGSHVWSRKFGDNGAQRGWGIALGPGGQVFLCGDFSGNIDFGGGNVANGGTNAFLAKLSGTDGSHVWSKGFGADIQSQNGFAIATGVDGTVAFTGVFRGSIDFGGGLLTNADGANTTRDIFVAKFDNSGNHLWSKKFGDASDQDAEGITIDGAGHVIVTGSFKGMIDFGGGALNNPTASTSDVFVAKLDSSAGNHLWSRRVGDAQEQRGFAVRAHPLTGDVIVGGGFQGMVDWGAPIGQLTSQGGYDWIAVKLKP